MPSNQCLVIAKKKYPTCRSLNDADKDPAQDYLLMALGYSTLLLFFLLTLGEVRGANFCVENRSLLSLCGVACVGLGRDSMDN